MDSPLVANSPTTRLSSLLISYPHRFISMSSHVDPSQLASTRLSDEFARYQRMVDRRVRNLPPPGSSLERIEEWGREFVDSFVSILVSLLVRCRVDAVAT